jgi:ribonucleoside-triphosphate reductase
MYHVAYNELLWDMKNAHLLSAYDAGLINLNNQYLTIGLNGLNQAAEFLGLKCNNNEDYKTFCKELFSLITEFIENNNGMEFGHKVTFNCEQVPAESLAIKNYNWDKADGYKVPEDTNLYASYIFKPNDEEISLFDKIILHSKEFAAEELSGGQAAHLNLSEHLSYEQYRKILDFAGKVGCNYFTFNVPNSECAECGFISKRPITECPKCHSHNINYYDRVIGYLTKIKNWSEGRQIEQKTRIYQTVKEDE